MINCTSNRKDMIIYSIFGLKKQTLYKNESILIFKSFTSFGGNINVKVDLSNDATKTDLENVTHVDN